LFPAPIDNLREVKSRISDFFANFTPTLTHAAMDVKIAADWKDILAPEFEKPYFASLTGFVRQEYATRRIFPRGQNIFRAFDKCPFDKLKVVIIGQDPYHGEGQANGLCFSVGDGVPFPPSLQNIFKEVSDDTGTAIPRSGNLDRWAEQGVLLLNAVLTVRAHEAASHAGRGWETFTDAVVRAIAERKEGIVYMLWGSYAQRKGAIADPQRNCILKAVHPSPLSAYRGFLGCRHFSRANEYLRSIGKEPINW
jgi:uracil-DNA glycosylase